MSKPKTKATLESAFENEGDEEIQDLSEEVNASYNVLLNKKAINAPGKTVPRPDGASKKPNRGLDVPVSENKLPEYPSSSAIDEQAARVAAGRVEKAFVQGNGWKTALEEGVRLELARAKKVFAQNSSAAQVYEKLESMSKQVLNDAETILQSFSQEAPKLLPNPKNKDLRARFEALKALSEQYEKEIQEWEAVDKQLIVPRIAPPKREAEEEFPEETADEELLSKISSTAEAPQQVVRIAGTYAKRLQRIKQDVEEAERETAALVTSYAKTAFEEDARHPKMLIQTLATSTTINEDTNASDF